MAVRVLHLTSTRYGLGGVESLLLAAADKYDRGQFEIAYCNLFCDAGGKGEFPTALRHRGLTYLSVPGARPRELAHMTLRLAALMRRERIEVVHTHMLQATLLGQIAALLAGVPVRLITRHYGADVQRTKPPLIRRADRLLTRKATHVIAVSGAIRDSMVQDESVAHRLITVVHNGIDLDSFDVAGPTPSPRQDAASPRSECVIGCVGSLTDRKGHADLFHCLALLAKALKPVRLVLIGEGPERERLEALAVRLGIVDRVHFAGFRRDVAPLLRSIDLYVHPSRSEPFGIAILEAMAARKAVIATAVGGIPEIVVPGETGLLVPPRDAPAIAAAVSRLTDQPALARRMGECGRERVERHFTIRDTVSRYQKIYGLLASSGRSREITVGGLPG